jgi:lipopolysaccharide/colanic/teichoic acid biosynthesis glycosyltransferase
MPERIPRSWRPILIGGDAAVVLFVSLIVLAGAPSRIAAAIVTAAIICGIFWQCGFYRRSFAVHPHDEAYFTCAGILLAAIPLIVLLASVADVPVFQIVLTLLFSAIGTSALHVRMHLERRDGDVPACGIPSITPGAWHDRESSGFLLSKRILDVSLAITALAIFSPVMLLAALSIFLEDRGTVFFRQERVGEGARPFWILKFRTMRADAGNAWAKPGDGRITKTGAILRRTSIDELPQLFNVLRGEMSIVGPRPEMVEFAAGFARSVPCYEQRHVVAPGITGWAQLYCKRNLQPSDMPDVLPCDLFYVEHASVVLDLALILKTAVEVVTHSAV